MDEIHKILANMSGLYSLIMAGWGLFLFIRRTPPDASYNGAMGVAVILYLIEGIVGVILLLMGLSPARGIHFLYGVTIALTIPAVYAFTRGKNTQRESLIYGIAFLFIWGLTDRAAYTAQVAQ